MRRDRKPAGRWLGEALLIFISVFGAFQLDNWRQTRGETAEYTRHLIDFKTDLLTNQGSFNYELRTTVVESTGEGYIRGNIDKYDYFDSLFSTPTRPNADTIMSLINSGAFFGLTRWIFESPQYEVLTSDFYSFIKNDALKHRIHLHHRSNESRITVKENINQLVKRFEDIQDELNLSADGNAANRAILFRNNTVNTIKRIHNSYYTLKSMTEAARERDSLLIEQIDIELELWGKN